MTNLKSLNAYAAKQCEVIVQNEIVKPCDPLSLSPSVQRRMEMGRDFETRVIDLLTINYPDLVVVDHGSNAEAETVTAMKANTKIIVKPRLPEDVTGHRVGYPDLLVYTKDGYSVIDIKAHKTVDPVEQDGTAFRSSLSDISVDGMKLDSYSEPRRHLGDLLQLAHYRRMLEACGFATSSSYFAGILGNDEFVTWHNLSAETLNVTINGKRTKKSALQHYDEEFARRVTIASTAVAFLDNNSIELAAQPARCGECDDCIWWNHCGSWLNEGAGDVTLLPFVSRDKRAIHIKAGVTNRRDLALLDYTTAQLIVNGIDVDVLKSKAQQLPGDASIDALVKGAPKKLKTLRDSGITTVAAVNQLHDGTARYSSVNSGNLPELIDQARAALGPAPVYLRREIQDVEVPRFDVEVDIDLENTEAGIYLWGAHVTAPPDSLNAIGYVPTFTWESLNSELEQDTFNNFWTWFSSLRDQAFDKGLTFGAYCYNAAVETTGMIKLSNDGVRDEVEQFVGSSIWIDLFPWFKSHVITGESIGLKKIADLANFEWESDDKGGYLSMVHYDDAVSDDEKVALPARDWLLAYNRNDTEATKAVRNWISAEGLNIPNISSLGPNDFL